MAKKDDNNPWTSPKKPKNPWDLKVVDGKAKKTGGKNDGGSNGQMPPDFDVLLKQIQDKFSGGGSSNGSMIKIILGVLLLLWLGSGFYLVNVNQHAVVQRFGRYVKTVTNQGLHYHLPYPIETVTKPNVTFERRIEIGQNLRSRLRGQSGNDESLMLTGDANIIDIDFVVQWFIGDAKNYLFNIRDPEGTIKKVAESAMREVVGQNDLQFIITGGRGTVATSVRNLMQEMLDDYQTGIMIKEVLIQDASVPSEVMDAFEDVIRADQDAETLRNQALQYQNDIVPKARGEAIQMLNAAKAYREQVINQANGDADRFNQVYSAYAQSKDVTRKRLYLETLEEVFANSSKVILDNEGGAGVLPYLPLDGLKTQKTGNQ